MQVPVSARAGTHNLIRSSRPAPSIFNTLSHHRQLCVIQLKQAAPTPPDTEELEFLMKRVAALERDLVKIQSMWDMNKGQRVIEVWMSLLNKKSYKPSNM